MSDVIIWDDGSVSAHREFATVTYCGQPGIELELLSVDGLAEWAACLWPDGRIWRHWYRQLEFVKSARPLQFVKPC